MYLCDKRISRDRGHQIQHLLQRLCQDGDLHADVGTTYCKQGDNAQKQSE